MTVSFIGHRDTPQSVKSVLRILLSDLINNYNATMFYVGNQGSFDNIVISVLKELKSIYHNIDYAVIIAYMPDGNDKKLNDLPTIYPYGLETVPRRYAISARNRWMIENSDIVVSYVTHNVGGAAKIKELAEKKHKIVINIAEEIKQPIILKDNGC